jgi:hypothetical protein
MADIDSILKKYAYTESEADYRPQVMTPGKVECHPGAPTAMGQYPDSPMPDYPKHDIGADWNPNYRYSSYEDGMRPANENELQRCDAEDAAMEVQGRDQYAERHVEKFSSPNYVMDEEGATPPRGTNVGSRHKM